MTYLSMAEMKDSQGLVKRITACAASEGFRDPQAWVWHHRWEWAATPGWDAKWESAAAGGDEDPGLNGAAITDGDLLARIQQIGDDPAPLPGPIP